MHAKNLITLIIKQINPKIITLLPYYENRIF